MTKWHFYSISKHENKHKVPIVMEVLMHWIISKTIIRSNSMCYYPDSRDYIYYSDKYEP